MVSHIEYDDTILTTFTWLFTRRLQMRMSGDFDRIGPPKKAQLRKEL